MLLESIQLQNLLSFGSESPEIVLRPLNVVIGPNGSGKSNFLEAINLLSHLPRQLEKPIRESGGFKEFVWKNSANRLTNPSIKVSIDIDESLIKSLSTHLQYSLSLMESQNSFFFYEEYVSRGFKGNKGQIYQLHHDTEDGSFNGYVHTKGDTKLIENIATDRSILFQLRDPDSYPELTLLRDRFLQITSFRDWTFGRNAPARQPQRADGALDFLEPDISNLGLILNELCQNKKPKERLLEALRVIYSGIEDIRVKIYANTVQVNLQEDHATIPSTRLSDGTLRYLCLLAILCHPEPPPLICIEEPELGLHPDVLPTLAKLLKEASERCQLIVTTHSDVLVDALSESPEDILVCEKDPEIGTVLRRLDKEELAPWLEKYSLGELWRRGGIGGNRW